MPGFRNGQVSASRGRAGAAMLLDFPLFTEATLNGLKTMVAACGA
jgi:hypothetical protein